MKNNYQKLWRVAQDILFCLACLLTKQVTAMIPQQIPEQKIRHKIRKLNQQLQPIDQRIQQINRQIRQIQQQLRVPQTEPLHTFKEKMNREQLQQPIVQQLNLRRQRSFQKLLLKDLLKKRQQK